MKKKISSLINENDICISNNEEKRSFSNMNKEAENKNFKQKMEINNNSSKKQSKSQINNISDSIWSYNNQDFSNNKLLIRK